MTDDQRTIVVVTGEDDRYAPVRTRASAMAAGSPSTVILPGQSVTWKEAWSVADPNSLTMQIAPSWDYENAVFTNIQ